MKAQAEQANKHDEKQDKVGNDDGDHSRFGSQDVECRTATLCRVISRAGLYMDVLSSDNSNHV